MKIFNRVSTKKKMLLTIFTAVLFFPMFVSAYYPDYSTGQGLVITNPGGMPEGTITSIITGLLNWLLGIFGVLGVIGFVIAGIIYLLSTGDETAITRAKSAMIWSIVGIIVGLSGFLIMQAIVALLGGASRNF